MDFKASLEMLQGIVTELTEGALVHKMMSSRKSVSRTGS